MLDATARCLARHEGAMARGTLAAAISGGADSTVLALVLKRLHAEGRISAPLHFLHVDHSVREDSRRNAQHVVDLGDRLDVPVQVRRLVLGGRPSEEAMRNARYQALLEMCGECGAALLLMAHHADDNLETVLFRMLRGTGPRGLAGIPEARWLAGEGLPVLLVRPFLGTRKRTLLSILDDLREKPYVDRTNEDRTFARNRLRLETIPRLRDRLGTGLDVTLMAVARTARAAVDILSAQGTRVLRERGRAPNRWRLELDLTGIEDEGRPFVEEALRQAHRMLRADGEAPLRRWTEAAAGLLDKPCGTRLCGRGGILVERTREGLLLVDRDRAGSPPNTEGGGQLLMLGAGRIHFGSTEWWIEASEYPQPPLVPTPKEAGRFRALIDPRSCAMPLRLRARGPADRFHPLGLDRDVSLRRFLQARHVPRFDRDRLPLVVDARDRVLWVPGAEVSELAKLRLDTRRTFELRAGAC
ncbi:MAG: tRNA lysidine(34) synthetase TilS [Planctomycetota bacterium]